MNKKNITNTIICLTVCVIIGFFSFYIYKAPKVQEGDVLSRNGIHIHPELRITVKGESIEIPAGIGISGISMKSIHTHVVNDFLHVEKNNVVLKEDVRLGNFFKIWGQTFNSNCIFDKCNGPDGTLKMKVNGQENTEFENYIMNDKDKIEIIYE